jgi:hypothetical protein
MNSNNGPQNQGQPWGTPQGYTPTGGAPQGYARPGFTPAQLPQKPKMSTGKKVGIGAAAFVGVLIVATAGGGDDKPAASKSASEAGTGFAWPDATTTAAPAATTPAGPRTSFGDGQYLVNSQIVPGTYQAPGGSNCYWERQSNLSGKFDGIIANDWAPGTGSVLVTIDPSDVGFKAKGCGTFKQVA